MTDISGRMDGLAPVQRKALERLAKRRVPPQRVVSPELARALSEWSRDTGRQLGALIDRRGHIRFLVVGNDERIDVDSLELATEFWIGIARELVG